MKKVTLALLFLLPFTSFAQVPAFPMAFWGVVTVDGTPAPVGSVIRVYSGTDRVGQVTVHNNGVYGYTEPTKQKLLVEETLGQLSFTVQSPGVNGGIETGGLSTIIHPSFVSGQTVEKNLAFSLTPAVSSGGTPSGGGGGGGGGGGSRRSKTPTVVTTQPLVLGQATTSSSTLSETELRIQLQKQIIQLLTLLIALLQERSAQ